MTAGAMMFALPSCAGLLDMLNEEGEENVDEDGDGKTDDNLPPYYNYKTEDSGNTIAFSFSMRAGSEPYYDVKYEWTFSGDVCTKCIETITCKTETIAILVAAEYSDDPKCRFPERTSSLTSLKISPSRLKMKSAPGSSSSRPQWK